MKECAEVRVDALMPRTARYSLFGWPRDYDGQAPFTPDSRCERQVASIELVLDQFASAHNKA